MDIIPEAIEDAKKMPSAWVIPILTMRLELQKKSSLVGTRKVNRADALIVDPPRTGLDDKLLDTIVKYAPERWSTFPAMYLPWRVI